MGDTKESVKGSGPPAKRRKKKGQGTDQNLLNVVSEAMDEVSVCIETKDQDTQTEGKSAKPENIRKAGLLRAVFSLLSASKTLLEEY